MPILPPRNLSLSSSSNDIAEAARRAPAPGDASSSGSIERDQRPQKGTPSRNGSPISKRGVPSSTNAGSSSPLRTPLKGSSPQQRSVSATLERQDETTYHRKLRSVLVDHCSACATWEENVSMQGAQSIAAAARAAAALDEALARKVGGRKMPSEKGKQRAQDLLEDDWLPDILKQSPEEQEAQRLTDVARSVGILRMQREALDELITVRLAKDCARLETLVEAAERQLVEATRAKGDDFTFEREMWTTWSMERFVAAMHLITKQHVLQTAQLQSLVRVFFQDGCATGKPADEEKLPRTPGAVIDITSNGKEGLDEESENDSDDDGRDQAFSARRARDKVATKRRARVRQRVLEMWQALPLLHSDPRGINAAWFEEICAAEVGRWNEQ